MGVTPRQGPGIAAAGYEAGVAVAGWGLLAWLTLAAGGPVSQPQVLSVLLFLLLAIVLKLEGFQVARLVTHSLVGVAVLGAVVALGPCGGAWVGALSSLLTFASRRPAPGEGRGAAHWRLAFFGGGLCALAAAGSGALYGFLGGPWAPITLHWRYLAPATALSLAWFLADHLGWSLRIGLEEGLGGLRRFLRSIQPYSLVIELLPLPLALLLAASFRLPERLAFGLLGAFLAGVAEILRRLNLALDRARERVADLTTLNAFSHALLASELDVAELCRLLRSHTAAVADASHFWLGFYDGHAGRLELALAADGQEQVRAPEPELADWMRKHRSGLLVRDVRYEELPYPAPTRPTWYRSALAVPLMVAGDLIGLLAVRSPKPGAYGEDALRTVTTFANQAAIAIANARALEAEQRRMRQLAAVGEVSRRVVSILGMDQLFTEVVHLVRDAFAYYHVQLFVVDARSGEVAFQASTSPQIQAHGLPVAPRQGLIGWVAESGEQVVVDDVATEPRYRLVEGLEEARSEAVVPLKVDERLVGILDVLSDRVAAFGEDDLSVLRTLADQVAIALEDTRLYRAERDRRRLADTLREIASALSSTLEPQALLDLVLTQLERVIHYDCAAILEWREGHYCIVAGRGARYAGSDRCLTSEEDVQLRQLITRPGPFVFSSADATASLAAPLIVKDRLIGALILERQGPASAYGEEDTGVASAFANQAAVAIENARLYEAQQEQAWVSTALLQVAELAGSTRDLDEILGGLVRLTPMLVGVDRCCVYLWDRVAQRYLPSQAYGLQDALLERFRGQAFAAGEFALLDRVREGGEPLAVEDVLGADLVPRDYAEALGMVSVLALPLRSQGEVLGLMLVDYVGQAHHFPSQRVTLLAGIANEAAIAIENVRLYRESVERERIAQELQVARQIQATFLPETTPQVPGWSIAVTSQPAREVGGDFYDFFPLGQGRLGLVIADVSDKGVPAALFMALSRTVTRAVAVEGHPPAVALARANDLLLADSRSGMFVTLFYGILHTESGRFSFASAGHNPPYWRRRSGEIVRLAVRGVALGAMEGPAFEEGLITIEPGDALVLYTDGVSESLDGAEREFGEGGLQAALRETQGQPADALIAGINRAVESFCAGARQYDDYTLLALTRDE